MRACGAKGLELGVVGSHVFGIRAPALRGL